MITTKFVWHCRRNGGLFIGLRINFPQSNIDFDPNFEWYCPSCLCNVKNEHVTFEETHDLRYNGCGNKVLSNAQMYRTTKIIIGFLLFSVEINCVKIII